VTHTGNVFVRGLEEKGFLDESELNELISLRDVIVSTDIRKELWNEIVYNIPCGYEYTRSVTFNYETFLSMYASRKNHKLDEWKKFCEKMRNELPYADYWLSILEGWIYI